jgi:hypothetical protein
VRWCSNPPGLGRRDVFSVYLDPGGSDVADGRTPGTAVKTLNRAQAILTAAAPESEVEVRIGQGRYVAPQVTWRFYVPGHRVSFLPADYEEGDGIGDIAGRPVFESDGSAGYWFTARLPTGHPGGATNLRFVYLQVEDYSSGGLQFYGGIKTNEDGISVPATEGVDGNAVYGMMFRDLGSAHNPASVGYGGINTWNSSGNRIENSHFVANENAGADAGLIHGIYFAHYSQNNVVRGNRFERISGGPMRTRDDSNGNDFGNRFIRAGTAYYSEWFCDSECVADNPGHARECASHANLFHENVLVSGYDGSRLPAWALTPPGIDYAGGTGCGNDGEPRVRTWGNTT